MLSRQPSGADALHVGRIDQRLFGQAVTEGHPLVPNQGPAALRINSQKRLGQNERRRRIDRSDELVQIPCYSRSDGPILEVTRVTKLGRARPPAGDEQIKDGTGTK